MEETKAEAIPMKTLTEKLQNLQGLGIDAFKKEFNKINTLHNSKEDKQIIEDFFKENAKKAIDENHKEISEISLKIKLQEVTEILSLSYIAKTYFKKSRQWFSQRLNNNIVNGTPAQFTTDEIKVLNIALQDISKKIGSISIM